MQDNLRLLGPRRGKESHSSELLIINESFYIESRDTEIPAEEWYLNGTDMLDKTDQGYVDYRHIFSENKMPDGRWQNNGCRVYRHMESALKEAGFAEIFNMLDHCTLANAFLRPAVNGKELDVCSLDREHAKAYILEIVESLKPQTIICASTKAYDEVVSHLGLSIPITRTAHPASAWWNKTSGNYGNMTGRGWFAHAAKEHLERRSNP